MKNKDNEINIEEIMLKYDLSIFEFGYNCNRYTYLFRNSKQSACGTLSGQMTQKEALNEVIKMILVIS